MKHALENIATTVITVSDRCHAGTSSDLSGPALVRLLAQAGATTSSILVPDEQDRIAAAIRSASHSSALILTTGGTGLAPRDVTPEATLSVCDRLVPGLSELIRSDGARQTPFAALSRGVCGVLGASLVLNLPGSPAGAENSLQAILALLPHALKQLAGNTSHED